MSDILVVNKLTKTFPSGTKALQGISFRVKRGSLHAFLGHNGAGKSTCINCICTFLQPTSGQVLVNGFSLGKDDSDIRRSLGVLFQDSVLDRDLTVAQNLQVRGALYGLSKAQLQQRIHELSQQLELEEILQRKVKELSGGQRRKADIARALIHQPQLLILDEPTTGLDPVARQQIWQTLHKLAKTGLTIFFSTHYLEEVEAAQAVTIIGKGKLLAEGTPAQLRQAYSTQRLELESPNLPELKQVLAQLGLFSAAKVDSRQNPPQAGKLSLPCPTTKAAVALYNRIAALLETLGKQELISDLQVLRGSLDDAFVNLLVQSGQLEQLTPQERKLAELKLSELKLAEPKLAEPKIDQPLAECNSLQASSLDAVTTGGNHA